MKLNTISVAINGKIYSMKKYIPIKMNFFIFSSSSEIFEDIFSNVSKILHHQMNYSDVLNSTSAGGFISVQPPSAKAILSPFEKGCDICL